MFTYGTTTMEETEIQISKVYLRDQWRCIITKNSIATLVPREDHRFDYRWNTTLLLNP